MKKRCTYTKHPAYARYKGLLCASWRESYPAFLADMGRKPTPTHTIDRIDTTRGYEAGNCRWATVAEQALNRRDNVRYAHAGLSLTLPEWGRKIGTHHKTLRARLKSGLSIEQAFK